MRVRPIFAWYDFWVGVYWDRAKRTLYVLPLPMVGVRVSLGTRHRCLIFVPVELHPKNMWDSGPMQCAHCGRAQT